MVDFTFIDANLLPRTYTQIDDIFAPDFPRVDYTDGNFIGLVFSSNFGRLGNFGFLDDVFAYTLTGFEDFQGTVVYSSVPVPFDFSPALGLIVLLSIVTTKKVFYKNKSIL